MLSSIDFHDAWEATDIEGKPIMNGVAYDIYSSTTSTMFNAKIGVNEIYPACDLSLHKTYLDKDNRAEQLQLLTSKGSDQAKEVNGRYSLHLDIEQ